MARLASSTADLRLEETREPELLLTCSDYPRLAPLVCGDVRPRGLRLTLLRGMRPDVLDRAIGDPDIAGGEGSLAAHLRRIDRGDRSLVGLPIFVQRTFVARYLYAYRGLPPEAIRSRRLRIGMYSWSATGTIWLRHFLRTIEAPLDSFVWTIGPTETGEPFRAESELPLDVTVVAPGVGLADMLTRGEIDLLFSPTRPALYHPTEGPIVRFFPDTRAVERDYYGKTRVFPAQHLLILKREAWHKASWIGQSLYSAFDIAERIAIDVERANGFASPWHELDVDEASQFMGDRIYAHGIEANRQMLDCFAQQAYVAGLTSRHVGVDELFSEFLAAVAGGRMPDALGESRK